MFPYINRLHDILKDQDPFPLIRMPLPSDQGPCRAEHAATPAGTSGESAPAKSDPSDAARRRVVSQGTYSRPYRRRRFAYTTISPRIDRSNCNSEACFSRNTANRPDIRHAPMEQLPTGNRIDHRIENPTNRLKQNRLAHFLAQLQRIYPWIPHLSCKPYTNLSSILGQQAHAPIIAKAYPQGPDK